MKDLSVSIGSGRVTKLACSMLICSIRSTEEMMSSAGRC